MKKTWNFQLLPGKPGILSPNRFRMDGAGEDLENRVNEALPSYLKFHGVNKIVLQLGPSGTSQAQYSEILGVGTWVFPDFDYGKYLELDSEGRQGYLKEIVLGCFRGLLDQYPDSGAFQQALTRLGW